MIEINDYKMQFFSKTDLLSCLDKYLDISFINEINPKFKKVPKYMIRQIKYYKHIISSMSEYFLPNYDTQYYIYKVYWNNERSVSTEFFFNIDRLDEIVKQEKNKSKLFSTSSLYKIICNDDEMTNPSLTDINKPIYISSFAPLIDCPFILDGNHRTYEAYLENKETISGIFIKEYQYFRALEDNNFRLLYAIYYGIQNYYRKIVLGESINFFNMFKEPFCSKRYFKNFFNFKY